MKTKKQDITEILFDESNSSPITLVNEEDRELEFEQVYATEYKKRIYCILSPLESVKDLDRRNALLFMVDKDNTLKVVSDAKIEKVIFNEYYSELKTMKEEGEANG